MRTLLAVPFCLLLILFTGCASSGRRLEVSAVRQIKIGSSTVADVEKLFGRPAESVAGSDQQTVARYFYRRMNLNNDVRASERQEHPADILFRTLSLRFGPDQVIAQKLHDEIVIPVLCYSKWLHIGPAIGPDILGRIRKGVSTDVELVEILGEPTSRTFETDGKALLIWVSIQKRADGFHAIEARRLVVKLDDKRVVREYAVVSEDMDQANSWFH